MNTLISKLFLVTGLLASAAACSSSSSSSPGNVGAGTSASEATDSALAKYCTGKLTGSQKLMKAMEGGWLGDGTLTAPAGTSFYVGSEFNQWEGFVVEADGTMTKVDSDFTKGLVKDTDFTSDCATADKLAFGQQHFALVAPATLYASQALTGTACTLPTGLELTSYSFSNLGGASQISSTEVKAQCSLDNAFSKDFEFAELIAK